MFRNIIVCSTGLEKALEETAGKYCVGDNISMADAALVPQVYNAIRSVQFIGICDKYLFDYHVILIYLKYCV